MTDLKLPPMPKDCEDHGSECVVIKAGRAAYYEAVAKLLWDGLIEAHHLPIKTDLCFACNAMYEIEESGWKP